MALVTVEKSGDEILYDLVAGTGFAYGKPSLGLVDGGRVSRLYDWIKKEGKEDAIERLLCLEFPNGADYGDYYYFFRTSFDYISEVLQFEDSEGDAT